MHTPSVPLNWAELLSAWLLIVMRLSGLFVFAPVFSSQAIPARVKAVLLIAIAAMLAPVAVSLPGAHTQIGVGPVLGELAIALVYSLFLSLLNEICLLAGQLVGMQFSFSLVNLLDPNSQIQTPLLGQMFSLLSTTVLVSAGLHRTIIAALLRTFASFPLGAVLVSGRTAPAVLAAAGGVFLAALQLAAPVFAATMLVEVTIALAARISPQIPVLALTVPVKTILGYVVLIGSLALWPVFLESRFSGLLGAAQTLLRTKAGHS